MAEVLKKFDRYFLLDRIAQGGMAEIFRARMVSTEAGGRLIVIKRIQSGYGANAEFINMFKSEIKVTMGFNHPNIVQVHDFGEYDQQPYIAMEFVDGKNLRQFLSRFTEMKQHIPVDLAAYIIEESAAGLFYAHSFKDKITGEPLNIIHRDISPQNVLISYEGNVKVIDFGIAKATTNSESTRAGVIKGKPSYLSPEQITGETLDARCDIFALGAVLWELLTGRKLFQGENDLAVLKMIESCSTHVKPPSTINPDVPKELDLITLKCLAKAREARYQTCDELRRALHKFIYGFNPDFNPGDLGYYAKDLFKNEIVEDRKRVQKLYERAEKLLSSDAAEAQKAAAAVAATAAPGQKPEDTTTVFNMGGDGGTHGAATQVTGSRPAPQAGAARGAGPVEMNTRPGQSGNRTRTGTIPGQRTGTRTQIPAQRRPSEGGGGSKAVVLLGIVTAVAVAIFGLPNFQAFCQIGLPIPACRVSPPTDTSTGGTTGGQANVTPDSPKAVTLKLRVQGGASGVVARLDGKPFDPEAGITIRPEHPLDLEVEKPGFKPLKSIFVVGASQLSPGQDAYYRDVALEPLSWGILNVRSQPSADATLIARDSAGRTPGSESKIWTKRTPFAEEKVPVGTYNLHLVNQLLGMEKTITVQVQEGKIVTVDEKLDFKGGGQK